MPSSLNADVRPGLKTLARHGLKVVAAAGLWLLLLVPASAATETPDAHQDGTGSSNSLPGMAQTFKALNTGQIDRVQLFIGRASSSAVNGSVKITGVTAGQPDESNVLATYPLVNFNFCCSWFDFTFSPGPTITAGSTYAIVVRTTPSSIRLKWWDNNTGDAAYPDGRPFLTSTSTFSPASGFDFAFRVYVLGGGSNSAPTITPTSTVVTATEGTAPVNTGTYFDSNGDTVTLRASAGTVRKTSGTSSGNWSWTGTASDEGPTAFVTITADDGTATTPTTFSVTINAAPPTAWIRSAPASAAEGSTVTLSGYGTSPSAEDTAGPWVYAWSVTKNGNPFGTAGTATSFSFTPDDDGAYVVSLIVTDDGNVASQPKSVSIIGTNVKPTAAITGVTTQTPLVMISQQELTFTGQFTDPGLLDTHTAIWDFGDSTTVTQDFGPGGGPTTFSATHSFGAARTYTVTLTVRDKDGGSTSVTQNVTIQTIPQALGAITSFVETRNGLTKGEKNSLEAKLNAATASFQRGNTNASCNQLNAFLNELDAQTKNGNVNPDDAGQLSAATRATQLSIGCFKDLTTFLGGL